MNQLQAFINGKLQNGGFLSSEDLPDLIKIERLQQVLVRCGGCRFTCAAQDVEHLIKCIDAGGDYVRDVSFKSGALAEAEMWRPEPPLRPVVSKSSIPRLTVNPRVQMPDRVDRINTFNPNDCGGVFDGSGVVSDADPGL